MGFDKSAMMALMLRGPSTGAATGCSWSDVLVIGSTSLGDGSPDGRKEINTQRFEVVHTEAAHKFIGQALTGEAARPSGFDVSDDVSADGGGADRLQQFDQANRCAVVTLAMAVLGCGASAMAVHSIRTAGACNKCVVSQQRDNQFACLKRGGGFFNRSNPAGRVSGFGFCGFYYDCELGLIDDHK